MIGHLWTFTSLPKVWLLHTSTCRTLALRLNLRSLSRRSLRMTASEGTECRAAIEYSHWKQSPLSQLVQNIGTRMNGYQAVETQIQNALFSDVSGFQRRSAYRPQTQRWRKALETLRSLPGGGGGGVGARSAGMICRFFGFKMGVANMQKHCKLR